MCDDNSIVFGKNVELDLVIRLGVVIVCIK